MVAIVTIPTNETVPSNAIYASYNGSSTAAGTEASPCSIVSAIGKANASGSTVVLTGVSTLPYRVGNISLGKSIRFIARPGDSPVLSGARLVSPSDVEIESTTGLYYFSQLAFTNAPAEAVDPAYPQSANKQQLFINNIYYKQVATKGALVAQSFFYQAPGSGSSTGRIYVKDNITTAGTRIEAGGYADVVKYNAGSAGTTWTGIGFEKYANSFGLCQQDNVKHDRCSFYHFAYFGAQAQMNDNYTITKCKFMYTGSNAIQGGRDGKNWLIEDNEVGYSNYASFEDKYNAAGMKITNSHPNPTPVLQNFIIRRNLIYATKGAPNFWLDINCTGYQVYDNVCSGGTVGIFLEISGSPTYENYIVNNFCYNNGYGIHVAHSQNAYIYNNVFSNNAVNFKFKDDNRINDNAEQVALGYDWRARNIRFVNNILNGSRANTGALVEGTSQNSRASTAMVSEMNNNAYYRSNANQIIYKGWNKDQYATLTEFKADAANSGYDTESIGRTAEASNPFFASDTNTTTKSTSPTKGKGKAVTGVVATILGVPSGTVVDIGNVRFLGQGAVQPDPEPADPCANAIEDATSALEGQLALSQDNLRAVNAQVVTLTAERDALKTERDSAVAAKDTAIQERDAAVVARDVANTDRDIANAALSTLNTKAVSDLTAVNLLVEQKLLTYQ